MYTIIINFKMWNRKSDNDIAIECSPAYATTELKTKLVTLLTITLNTKYIINNRSTVEPVYDTTGSETPLPSSTEYETPTV